MFFMGNLLLFGVLLCNYIKVKFLNIYELIPLKQKQQKTMNEFFYTDKSIMIV